MEDFQTTIMEEEYPVLVIAKIPKIMRDHATMDCPYVSMRYHFFPTTRTGNITEEAVYHPLRPAYASRFHTIEEAVIVSRMEDPDIRIFVAMEDIKSNDNLLDCMMYSHSISCFEMENWARPWLK